MKTPEKEQSLKKKKIQTKEWLDKSSSNFKKKDNKLYKERMKKNPV